MRLLFAIILCMACMVDTAAAQTMCGNRAEIVNRLTDGYEERQTSAGIARNGSLVEVFTSKEGSWTIIYTVPGGPTCIMAVGDSWQVFKKQVTTY